MDFITQQIYAATISNKGNDVKRIKDILEEQYYRLSGDKKKIKQNSTDNIKKPGRKDRA